MNKIQERASQIQAKIDNLVSDLTLKQAKQIKQIKPETKTFQVIAVRDIKDEYGCIVAQSGEKIKIEATKQQNGRVSVSVKKPYEYSESGIYFANLTKNEALALFQAN
jgi:hypothetical protein